MNAKLSKKAINTIESLCGLGCTRVNQILEDVQNGSEITELNEFNASEKEMIIGELDQIMSVYIVDNTEDHTDSK